MKSKKRYVIAFWIAASLVVALGIGMVAVLAAFTQTTAGGNFTISYTAYHVNATVTAAYQSPSATSFTNLEVVGKSTDKTLMQFTADTVDSQSFTPTTDLVFKKDKTVAYLRYSIENDNASGGAGITVTKNFKESTDSNIEIVYAKTTSATIPTTSSAWQTTANAALAEGTTISANSTIYFFVRITLKDTTKSVGANFACSYNFTLDAVDAN